MSEQQKPESDGSDEVLLLNEKYALNNSSDVTADEQGIIVGWIVVAGLMLWGLWQVRGGW